MLYIYSFFLIFPIYFFFFWYLKIKKKLKYNNILKFITVLIFFLFLNIFYALIILPIFFYNNMRFFRYFFTPVRPSRTFFKKLSIYFLWWRYFIIIYSKKIYIFFYYYVLLFYNNFVTLTVIKLVYFYYYYFILNNFINNKLKILLYFIFIKLLYHLNHILNIDEIYKKRNLYINKAYIFDPFNGRYEHVQYTVTKFYNLYFLSLNNIKIHYNFLKLAYLNLFIFFNLIKILNKNFLILNNELITLILLYQVYNINLIKLIKNLILLILNFCNFILLQLIYLLTFGIINLIQYIIKNTKKYKKIFFIFFCIFLFFNFIYIFNYYIYILYKHYMLYLPIIEFKQSLRFFNFEWIDWRNYYNLLFFHNSLVDLNASNNLIYNDILYNLNLKLKGFGFKFTPLFNVKLHSVYNLYNKDTMLLNELLKNQNEAKSERWVNSINRAKRPFHFWLKCQYMLFRWAKSLRVYSYTHLLSVDHKEDVATELIEELYKMPSYLLLKKKLPEKYDIRVQAGVIYAWNRLFRRKRIVETSIFLSCYKYLHLDNIPLKYIAVPYKNVYPDIRDYVIYCLFSTALQQYQELTTKNLIKSIVPFGSILKLLHHTYFFSLWMRKKIIKDYYFFYFKRIYCYEPNYFKNFKYIKNNIPLYTFIESKYLRKPYPKQLIDPAIAALLPQDYNFKLNDYNSLDSTTKKDSFDSQFLKFNYPYYLNNKYNVKIVLNDYYCLLNKQLKIIKKYYFLWNTRVDSLYHFNTVIIQELAQLSKLWMLKYTHMDNLFIYRYVSKKKNFWSFFDFLKYNKHYTNAYSSIYKSKFTFWSLFESNSLFNMEEYPFNGTFFKHNRKDYINFRNYLLRYLSVHFHYITFKQILATMYSSSETKSEYYNYIFNFKKKWHFWITIGYSNLDKSCMNNVKNLCYIFNTHFSAYQDFITLYNEYNETYYKSAKLYKLRVLNKIVNLKRYFYFKNKDSNDFSIFKYLNSFSISYHIKHLLWHSPYSYFFIKNSKINSTVKDINNIYFFYIKVKSSEKHLKEYNEAYIEYYIDTVQYSTIFNLYLNIPEIKEDWSSFLTKKSSVSLIGLYHNTFNYYYKMGKFILFNINLIDLYRILITLMFKYYNNFLYKISRFEYILNKKKYTLLSFFLRYYNIKAWWDNLYIRFRFQIYRFALYAKMLTSSKLTKLEDEKSMYFRTNRNQKIPFWFLFNEYIKIFVYFLLQFYYIKYTFILWWLNNFFGFNIIFINYLYLKYLFFIKVLEWKILFFKFKSFKFILFNTQILLLNWYLQILLKFNYYILFKFCFLHYVILFKTILVKLTLQNIFIIKDFFFNKIIYLSNFKNYIKLYYDYKNSNIYFKTNYYYFRKQGLKTDLTTINRYLQYSFHNVLTLQNKNSFYHLTKNFYFYKNLYFYTLNTWMYLYQQMDLNFDLNHFASIFFTSFTLLKYNLYYATLWILIIVYFLFWLFVYLFYNSFYNIFFFHKKKPNIKNKYSYTNFIFFKPLCVEINKKNIIFKNYKTISFYNNYFYFWFVKFVILNKHWNLYKFYVLKFYKLFALNSLKKKIYNKKFLSLTNYMKNINLHMNLSIYDNFKHGLIYTISCAPSYIFMKKLYKLKSFFKIYDITFESIKYNGISKNFYLYNFTNRNIFPICFAYWIIFLPFLCIEYILWRLNISGHIRYKRRWSILVRIFFDNFKIYINLTKLIGDEAVYTEYKVKELLNLDNALTYITRPRVSLGYYFKWDRLRKIYIRMSPLGTYYYWFFNMNKKKYYIDTYKFFFNTILFSTYYIYIYILYILMIYIIIKYIYKINILK